MYQNNEIDFYEGPIPPRSRSCRVTRRPQGQVYSGVGDFPTWYIFFDVTIAPWTRSRSARPGATRSIATPSRSRCSAPTALRRTRWLAPGFPASQRDELKDIQGFDPDKAKQLLADAGFPDGKDFPKQNIVAARALARWTRRLRRAGAMIKENLNIDVELLARIRDLHAALNAKPTQILFGYVRYGMDYLDPSNMLSVWKSGGRHSWSNPEFDKSWSRTRRISGDPAERIKMFQDAEKILVADVPGVFVYHGTPVQLIKPWVKGEFIAPDKNGITACTGRASPA